MEFLGLIPCFINARKKHQYSTLNLNIYFYVLLFSLFFFYLLFILLDSEVQKRQNDVMVLSYLSFFYSWNISLYFLQWWFYLHSLKITSTIDFEQSKEAIGVFKGSDCNIYVFYTTIYGTRLMRSPRRYAQYYLTVRRQRFHCIWLLRFRWKEMITLSYTIVVQIRCLCSPDIAVGKHLLFLVSGNQYQFLRILKQERKNATSCACVWY